IAAVGKENLQFVDSLVLISQQMIEEQNSYFELGLITQEDLDQLNYSLLTAKNAQISAQIQYQNSISLLKLTMGYPMESELEVTETADELMQRSNLKESIGNISENRTLLMLENQKTL